MFGFKNKENKKLAINMMVIEYTNLGMLEHLARIMAEKQIKSIIKYLNNKMPFPMVMSVMAWVIHIEVMLDEGDEREEILITSLQEMVSRYITGLHKVYDELDDYDKKILSGVETAIKLNKKYIK